MNGRGFSTKTWLLAGASWAALACWLPPPASAADLTAGTDQQLRDAVAAANASPDASSTITLTGGIAVLSQLPAPVARDITIITQGFTLSGLDNPSGAGGGILVGNTFPSGSLTISGTLVGGSGTGATGGAGLLVSSGSSAATGTVVNNGTITGGAGSTGGNGVQTSNAVTIINGGTIAGGAGSIVAGGAGALISNGGTLINNNNGTIQGGAGPTNGSHGVFLSTTVTGATLINGGIIRGGANPTGGTGGGVGVRMTTAAVNTITNTGTIEGGAGAQAMLASTTGADTILINSGAIRAGAGQANAIEFGSGTGAVTTLELQAGSLIIGNVIAGAGTSDTLRLGGTGTAILDGGIGAGAQYRGFEVFEKTGSGTWILAGESAIAATFQIQAGTLHIGNGGSTGSLAGDIANAGTLVFNRSDTLVHAGAISGAGAVRQEGTGTTILTGNNTYTGATTVTTGTLALAAGGQVTASSITTVQGTGTLTITGAGTRWQTGTVTLGNSGGGTATLNVSDGAALVVNTYAQSTVAGPATSVAVTGGGQVTTQSFQMGGPSSLTGQNATILVSGAGSTWSHNGILAFHQGSISVLDGGGFTVGALQIGRAGGGTAELLVSGVGSAFHSNGSVRLGNLGGGTGIITLANGGRFTGDSVNFTIGGFAGSTGVLNIGGAEGAAATSAGVLQVAGNIAFGPGGGRINFNHTDAAHVFAPTITGAGAVNQTGPGTTILTADNTYTGTTTISAGTLQLGNGGTTGSIVTDVANNGVLAFNRGDTVTYAGIVSGSGALHQAGTGTTVLTGTNSYTGGTVISAGTLQIGAGASTGSIEGNVLNNGVLAFNRSDSVTFAGAVSGSGALRHGGAGTLILTGDSSYTGGTTITAGTLQIGDGGATGSIQGDVLNNATLAFNRSDSVTFGGVISGSGALRQDGAGITILTGANSYAGGTTITAGTLQLGNGSTTGSIQGDVLNDGVLAFNRSDAVTFGGAISGSGALRQDGSGTTILTGANTYAGGTTITAGMLQLGAGGTAGSIQGNVLNNGTLAFNRSDSVTFGGAISGSGVLRQDGAGTTILTGANTYAGGTIISAGTLQIGAGGTSGSIVGDVLNNGTLTFNRSDSLAFGGSIAGSGALVVTGGGTVILTGNSSYTGGTTILSGTLRIGDGGTSGSIIGDVRNDSPHTLVFDRSDRLVFAGVISGIGAVRQDGSGITVLTGNSTYAGGTTITAGTLQLGAGGTTGSIQGDVANSGTLAFNRSDRLTFAGAISGGGGVRQDGGGVTVLSGANTYSGPTAVNAGTLRAGAAGAFSASSAVAVAAGATLDLAGLDQTVAGLANAGLVTLGGAPGTRLTVAGTYAGQGGVLALNTMLGGDGSASDRLVIQGGGATGDTRIRIANIGGPGVQTVEGIRVVEVANGGTTAAGAFRFDTRVAAGAFEYQLFRGGNASADDWYLRSFLLATPASPETPATPSSPGIPLYRPEVPLYAPIPAVGRQMGLATLGTLHARRGEELEIAAAGTLGKQGEGPGTGAWARAFGERRRDRWDGPAEARTTGNLIGIQAGFDILRTGSYGGGHRDVAGLYVAYADYNAPNVAGLAIGQEQRVGRLLMSGPAVGAYWTHYGPSGWYVDAVFQANWFDVSARSDFGSGLATNGTGYAAALEAGYPIRFGGNWQIEPQAQVIWQGTSIDRARDAFSAVDWEEGDAVTGRLGARLQYTGRDERTVWQPYAKLDLWHAFSGTDRARFGITPIDNRFGGTSLELGAGITARVSETTSFYAHADYRWSLDGDRARESTTQGTIGIRVIW